MKSFQQFNETYSLTDEESNFILSKYGLKEDDKIIVTKSYIKYRNRGWEIYRPSDYNVGDILTIVDISKSAYEGINYWLKTKEHSGESLPITMVEKYDKPEESNYEEWVEESDDLDDWWDYDNPNDNPVPLDITPDYSFKVGDQVKIKKMGFDYEDDQDFCGCGINEEMIIRTGEVAIIHSNQGGGTYKIKFNGEKRVNQWTWCWNMLIPYEEYETSNMEEWIQEEYNLNKRFRYKMGDEVIGNDFEFDGLNFKGIKGIIEDTTISDDKDYDVRFFDIWGDSETWFVPEAAIRSIQDKPEESNMENWYEV